MNTLKRKLTAIARKISMEVIKLDPNWAGDMIGIWLVSGEMDAPGMVLSVNGAAHQFSGMRMVDHKTSLPLPALV